MKRLIFLGLMFVVLVSSLGGCFVRYDDGYGRGERRERGEGHEEHGHGDMHEERR